LKTPDRAEPSNGFFAEKDLIDVCLAEKNPKVPEYRQKATQIWLMIINDQWRGAGEVYVNPEQAATWTFDFPFDKVLLYCRPLTTPATVIELRKI
jgi:hypothetical protein